MPSFSDSFWSNGYSSGLSILFDKLHQGCIENDEVLALAQARADAEEHYGRRLQEIPFDLGPKKSGFGRDDGASLRRAYEGIITEMGEEGRNHLQVAENIRRMVLTPFGKWADEHRQRVDYSHGVLKQKLKSYEKEMSEVQKCQKRYFNKCRLLEDFKEGSDSETGPQSSFGMRTNSQHANAPDKGENDQNPPDAATRAAANAALEEHNNSIEESSVMDDPVELGDEIYSPDEARALFEKMLQEIPQKDVKIAILGTYEHVSSGDQIVEWALQNVAKNLAEAERFGQNLVNSGYLRLVGQVGSKFANSSVLNYQWRKKAFAQAGKKYAAATIDSSSFVGGYLGDTINNYINNPHPDETPEERLKREVFELDMRYKTNVVKLDDLRCSLEEAIIDHLKFMERCETDRLKAVKSVFLDFLATLSNVVPTIRSAVDKQLLFQETIHPSSDLRYVLESYRTGTFSPKVTVYDNYYNSTEDQTFGVDLEMRCRGDKKRVPFIVAAILHHMDGQYPDLENDKVRLGVWTVSVPLNSTHRLRKELNTGKQFDRDALNHFEAPIVASVLKLYLVELPDSLIPSQYYDIIKTIYSQHGNDEDARPRIAAIQNTVGQLRVTNIATLDAITTHLTRLISITKASPEYITQLAQEFSHCILRPRSQSSLNIGDRHAFRLMYDLLTNKDLIFSGLKRNNSNPKSAGASRHTSGASNSNSRANSGAGTTHQRRPSLQNRLDALSLKIRKSNSTGSGTAASSEEHQNGVNGAQELKKSASMKAGEVNESETVHDESPDQENDNQSDSNKGQEDAAHSAARHDESLISEQEPEPQSDVKQEPNDDDDDDEKNGDKEDNSGTKETAQGKNEKHPIVID